MKKTGMLSKFVFIFCAVMSFQLVSAGFSTEFEGEPSPLHTYETDGELDVSLTATNVGGSDTETIEELVFAVPDPPSADFEADETSGDVPHVVQFTDRTDGVVSGRAWYFGDESYSGPWSQQNEQADWGVRTAMASSVLPCGAIVIMGGRDRLEQNNDVWRSDD